ncbi:MAG: hypothetical protein JKY96_08855 [Phycisphaerales bacterium]|nr:hypothetical protein [Phycisphaerales bacterium]
MKTETFDLDTLERKMNRGALHLVVLFALLFVVVVLWETIPKLTIQHYDPEQKTMTPGTYGDTFGSVNALFAGLAFAGLLWSIWQTNNELKIQKKIVLLQIKDQRDSKKTMESQSISQANLNLQLKALTSSTVKATKMDGLIALLHDTQMQITDINNEPAQHLTRDDYQEHREKITSRIVNLRILEDQLRRCIIDESGTNSIYQTSLKSSGS